MPDIKDGRTALIATSSGGHTKIVKTLIKAGADVNVKDKEGRTALMHALSKEHTEIVNLLKAVGATE